MDNSWQLVTVFFKIGLFSIGGGYAVIPAIRQQVVTQLGWISDQVFADMITISQMTPGPLAVNTSTFVGIRIAGIPGAILAVFGVDKITLGLKPDIAASLLFVISVILLRKWKINPMMLMVLTGIAGVFF